MTGFCQANTWAHTWATRLKSIPIYTEKYRDMKTLWHVLGLPIVFLFFNSCSGVIDEASLSPQPLAATSLAVSPTSPSNDTTPSVSGTTTASASVKLYSGSNCSGITLGTGSATSTGSFSINSSALAEGDYSLSVLSVGSGGSTCSENSVAYAVDTTVPVFTISAPSALLVNSSSAPITYSVNYISTSTVNLLAANVLLNATGTATCAVSVTDGTTFTPSVSLSNCTGNGTIRMSISSGTALDSAGNLAGTENSKGTVTVDNAGPTSVTYNPATGIYSTISASVVITFAEIISGTSVTAADFSVTGSCGTLPTLAVTSVIGSVVTVSLTGASCALGQTAIITTLLAGITDPVGNAGVGTVSATYNIDNIGPTSASFNPVTARVLVIPTSVNLTFNESVTPSSVVSADFAVSGTCTTLPTLSVTNVSGTLATLGLAGATCSVDQTVILTLNLANVSDITGNPGSGSSTVTYTFDNVGPVAATISPVTATVAIIPASIAINFTENLLASSVSDSDLVVSGTCGTLPTATLSSVSTATATFALAGASCSVGQTVIVTMDGSAITDSIGNAGTGSVTATYTFDNVGPMVTSSSPTTGTVNAVPTSVTFSFDEALLASSVAATDVTVTGSCSTLPTISLTGVAGSTTTFGLAGAVCANGQNAILVMQGLNVTDLLANVGSGSVAATFTIDNAGPTPSSVSPAAANLINMPASVSITFDESVLASSVTAADLGISGTCTTLPTASVASVIGSVVTFALSAATCVDSQTLILTVLGSSVTDLIGNAGSNNQVVTYTKDTTGPSAISFSPATSTVISIPTSVSITFDETLLAGSVAAADFTVSGTCNILPTHSVSAVSGQQVFVSLSGAVCNNNQTTILTVNGSGINDTAGNTGLGTPAVSYTVDSAPPNVSGFTPNSGVPPATLTVTFSENLNPATVTLADFTLSGTCTSKTLSLTSVTNNVVELDINGGACASGETVIVTIDAANVTDVVGNAGSGSSFVTFTEL